MQQRAESVRCYSWGKLKCCVNDTGNLVPRRSLWSNLGFMGETFPPSKFTANWYDVTGAACQKTVRSTGMVNRRRLSHRSTQHIKVGSKCTTSETTDFEKWTSHLEGSRIHHVRKCKRLFVNVCDFKTADFYCDGIFNRTMTVQKRRRVGGLCQTNIYNSVE